MAKKNKKTPLKQIQFDGPDLKNDLESAVGLDQFSLDNVAGLGASAISAKPVDNKATDDYLAQIEKPTGGSVYDKMAARYRSQGEGAVLRTQKGLANLFQPTITLIKEREAAAQARFTLLKSKMPEFDDSTIFGHQSGNEMPIIDEIKSISSSVKEDLRMLSRLNPNDERYDVIKKKVEKNQDDIVAFDAVNKQLLKIRNAGTDESQWSAGMDETTANMWRDIYTSNGKNIKIQDGKLIWTDTKGTTSYEFEGVSRARDKYKALGGANTNLGRLASWTTNRDGEQLTFENGEEGRSALQADLNIGGFTDADGNKLEEDGEWGPKSQAAYDKYLEQKDGLEKAWLDENLPEDSEFRKTTGTGETKTINLDQIGDGPTSIDSEATNMDRVIQGDVQKFIEMGGKVDDPMYNQMIKAKLFELNKIGPQGIKSLIFDGIGTDDDDLFTGMNTDSFIEGVIENHYGKDLSESEIERHVDMMRSGDVTQMYKDEAGKKTTLQSQFMKWYKGEVDNKITEGKKSKVVRSATGGGGGSGRGGGGTTQSRSGDLSKTGLNLTFGAGRQETKYDYSNKTANGYPLEIGEVALTGSDIKEIGKGNERIEDYMNTWGGSDIVINNDNEIVRVEKDGRYYSAFNADSIDPKEVLAYNAIMEAVRLKIEQQGGTFEYKRAAEWSYISTRAEEYRKKMGDAIGDTILEQMQDRSNDNWKYWNEDIKYDSDGNEVTSTYADEIRDDEFTD